MRQVRHRSHCTQKLSAAVHPGPFPAQVDVETGLCGRSRMGRPPLSQRKQQGRDFYLDRRVLLPPEDKSLPGSVSSGSLIGGDVVSRHWIQVSLRHNHRSVRRFFFCGFNNTVDIKAASVMKRTICQEATLNLPDLSGENTGSHLTCGLVVTQLLKRIHQRRLRAETRSAPLLSTSACCSLPK